MRSSWLARAVAVVAGAATLAGGIPATAVAAGSDEGAGSGDAAQTLAGYTDKSARKEAGRATVKSGVMQVTDGSAPAGTGTTYYVDAEGGDDTNAGTSESAAWKSLEKVSATTFQPGDRILLKTGSVWNATGSTVAKEAYDYSADVGKITEGTDPTALLAPKGSGTADAPIVLSSYGTGAAPELNGRGVVNDTVQLMNQQYWDISNLEITNVTDGFDATKFEVKSDNGQIPGTENPAQGDLRGLHIAGEKAGELKGFTIHDLFIHDVSGVTWSVSKAGIDRSKRTGGILFEGLLGDATTPTVLSDIDVYDNTIANTSFANIVFKQASGNVARTKKNAPGWGDRYGAGTVSNTGTFREDAAWRPHNDIVVSDNYMTNRDTQYGWDSMYLTSVQGATVEDNVIDASGVSGIEMYFADNVAVRNNDVGEMQMRTGAADTNGIDPDTDTTNILIEHNYVHDSGEGILLCGFNKGSSAVVRYNVIRDIERNYVNPHGGAGVNVIYNNLMVNDIQGNGGGNIRYFATSGSAGSILRDRNRHFLLNNAFVNTYEGTTQTTFQTGGGVTYASNAYSGVKMQPAEGETNPVVADDLGLKGDTAKDIANAVLASASSPLLASGAAVDLAAIAPGFKVSGAGSADVTAASADFFGKAINATPNIGATTVDVPQGKAVVAGVVRNQDGAPVPDATVTYGDKSVKADANGHYGLELEPGAVALQATDDDFSPSESVSLTLKAGTVTAQDLTLGATLVQRGTVSGTVLSVGLPVEGADVTVTNAAGETVASATTDASGQYSVRPVAGDGYTVTVAKAGYETATQTKVTVANDQTVTLNFSLVPTASEATTILDEDFNNEAAGDFSKTADGALAVVKTADVGTVTVEQDPADATNKVLKIAKTSKSKGTLGVANAAEANLTGMVTIEARIQRTTTNGAPNQAAMYAYDESTWNEKDPAASSDPTATFGISGGKLFTHKGLGDKTVVRVGDANPGTWYDVKYVADVDSGEGELFVDGASVWKGTMRTKVTNLDRFLFFINGTNTGDLLIDSFKVTQGAASEASDTTLSAISLKAQDGSDVALTRDGNAFTGTVTVFDSKASLSAEALGAKDGATVTINGQKAAAGEAVEVALKTVAAADGDLTIDTEVPVVVTAADGTTSTTYTVTIKLPNPSQTTYLKNLAVDGYAFKDGFDFAKQGDADPQALADELPAGTKSVTVTFERGWAAQTVKVNGTPVAKDESSVAVPVQEGANTIKVAPDSFTGEIAEYVITFTVAKASEPTPTVVDKSALQKAVDEAAKLNEADYTAESWKPFSDALQHAQDVLKDKNADQDAVDQAAEALAAAQSALVAVTPNPDPDPDPTPDPDPNPNPEPTPGPGDGDGNGDGNNAQPGPDANGNAGDNGNAAVNGDNANDADGDKASDNAANDDAAQPELSRTGATVTAIAAAALLLMAAGTAFVLRRRA